MFQILKNPNFDFMGKRNVLLAFSTTLVVASLIVLAVKGLNLGIEFQGGTELRVRFAETPDVGRIRSMLADAGMTKATVTTLGDPQDNEIYIRLAGEESGTSTGDMTSQVTAALRSALGGNRSGLSDLNILDEDPLERLVEQVPGLSAEQAKLGATSILEARQERAIFHSFEDLVGLEHVTPEMQSFLKVKAFTGPFAIRSQGYIGPAVGRELLRKAIGAIVGSLIGMLIYIWVRFQFQWGFAAVIALTHDTVVTLGLFSLFNQEMSLPVVAAFLSLVGYSVNDTVVIFDRIRESLRTRKATGFVELINTSINQTLSRTVITSGVTWIVCVGLFVFGGAALRPFSFVLMVGVLVGSYSSISIAAPILVMWKNFVSRRRETSGGPMPAASGEAKKVRTSSTG